MKSVRQRQWVSASIVGALGMICVLMAGCEVGPNYRAPKQPMPASWSSPPTTQASVTVQQPIEIERWWTTFADPELDSLIHRAVESNLDLRLATERIRAARASLGITTSGFFPTVDLSGAYKRAFSAGGGVISTTTGTSRHATDLWTAGLDASWELDIFGGVRRSIEAANANLQAEVENRRDVLVTLLGEVATDYISLRGFQEEIVIAQQNLDAQIRNVSVVREKIRLGTGTGLDLAQADAIVASTRATIETLQILEQQTLYSLSVLLGLPPTALDEELSRPGPIPVPPPVVPVGMPSELLRRRPDIRRAERQLAQATAEIGVATADLFPKFSLTGTLTLSGDRYQALGNWGTRAWSFGPSVSWPIFDAGKIWANIEVQNAVQAQALTSYKTTVLLALQEVQNSLVAYAREQQRRLALADAVAANQRAVELATRRYQAGQTDFINVLDSQRSLFGAQDALVQSNRAVSTDLVAVYKALGGGWEAIENPTTQPSNVAPTTQPTVTQPVARSVRVESGNRKGNS